MPPAVVGERCTRRLTIATLPTVFISLGAVRALPSNVTSAAFGNYSQQVLDFGYLPPGHFGNITAKDQLPQQNVLGGGANITNVTSFSELGNVGNLTDSNVTWAEGLATALANRYISAAFCSWFSTGGSIPGLLNQLPEADLNATKSVSIVSQFSAWEACHTPANLSTQCSWAPLETCLKSSTFSTRTLLEQEESTR